MKIKTKTVDDKLKSFLDKKRTVVSDSFRVMPETFDEESRTLKLVATTNYPYLVGFFYPYEEILDINESAIDLDRLKGGNVPLLKNHDNDIDAILGRIIDYDIERAETRLPLNAPTSEYKKNLDKLVVTVHFDDDEYNREFLFPKIKSGSIRNVSIGYRITEYDYYDAFDMDSYDRVFAKQWELFEVSLVAVPADPNAGTRGVDKDKEKIDDIPNIPNSGENKVDEEEKKALLAAERKKAEEEKQAALEAQKKEAEKKEKEKIAAERSRVATITQIAEETGLKNLAELIEKGTSVNEVRQMGYEAMLKKQTEVNPIIETGRSGDEVKVKDFQDALLKKTKQNKGMKLEKGNEFAGMSLIMAMKKLVNEPYMNDRQFMKKYFYKQERVLGQGSFPNLIEDAVNRNLQESYMARRNPFAGIVETEEQNNLHDFKQRRFDVDLEPDLVKEGEDITIGTPSGEGNEIEISKFAKGFSLTEEAILNDDLGGLDRVFMYLGHGMTQRETRLIVSLLFDTSILFDGAALYSTDRRNLATGTNGGVITANVKALRTQMRKQLSPAGKPIDTLFPSFLICGEDLAEDAKAYLTATIVPDMLQEQVATFREGITNLITHPYIDSVLGNKSDKDFLLAANPMTSGIPIVKRVIHSDFTVPEVMSEYNMTKSSLVFISKFFLGIGLGDYRGLAKFQQA